MFRREHSAKGLNVGLLNAFWGVWDVVNDLRVRLNRAMPDRNKTAYDFLLVILYL